MTALAARPGPPLASWVVSRAVLELCWLARRDVTHHRLAGRIELVDLADPAPREVLFGPHAQCGCGWLL